MTQDEIIEMARQADIKYRTDVFYSHFCDGVYEDDLRAFAKLVAEAEREACAQLLESRKTGANELMDAVRDMEARAIRARGEQT
jgi:hypothetical protein